LKLFPGWKPNGKEDTVRMPGWWDTKDPDNPNDDQWNEDLIQVSTHTGNMAWAIIALLSYYEKGGGIQYRDAAITLGDWIELHCRAAGTSATGGYTGGYEGWEKPDPPGPVPITWKSTEHNIDVYVAFIRLYEATGDQIWKDRALNAKNFVKAMWDEAQGHFWTGTEGDGESINKSNVPADVNTWGLMALGNEEKYGAGIAWVENNCYVEADEFKGFDFNNDHDHVWLEGTAHMVIAYQLLGDTTNASTYLFEIIRAQKQALNSNGKGIVAAGHDGLSTGFMIPVMKDGAKTEIEWLYYNRLHIGATAWFIFAGKEYNPYWGIKTTDPVPVYD